MLFKAIGYRCAGALLFAALIAMGSCGTTPTANESSRQVAMGPSPMTGIDGSDDTANTDAPPDIEAILAANAAALQDLDALSIERRRPSVDAPTAVDTETGEDENTEAEAMDSVAAAMTAQPQPDMIIDEPVREPELTREQRISQVTEELAMLLRAQIDQSDIPVSSMAALIALELIERGVAPDPDLMPLLSARERELLSAFHDLFSEAGIRLEGDPNDLLGMHEIIAALPDRLRSWKRLSIPVAALCTRVDGFGQYQEFGSNKFLAGQPHRMIVYTELADFHSEVSTGSIGEEGRRVRLTQDLRLYHDADGLLAWRQANQPINEFSRNERRDFFLVQLIELPRTLTVGSYRLKVTLVDEVAGATAEAIIPIDIVADARLVGG